VLISPGVCPIAEARCRRKLSDQVSVTNDPQTLFYEKNIFWHFLQHLKMYIKYDMEQWFSTLNARRPTKDKYEHFGGPPLSF